jgi:hypothetical protein
VNGTIEAAGRTIGVQPLTHSKVARSEPSMRVMAWLQQFELATQFTTVRPPARLLVDSLFPIKHADFRPGLTHWLYGHCQNVVIRRNLDLLSARELAIDLVG